MCWCIDISLAVYRHTVWERTDLQFVCPEYKLQPQSPNVSFNIADVSFDRTGGVEDECLSDSNDHWVDNDNASGSKSSTARTFAPVLRSKSSRVRKFSGPKVTGSESSTPGTFAPGSEWSWELKVQLPFAWYASSTCLLDKVSYTRKQWRIYDFTKGTSNPPLLPPPSCPPSPPIPTSHRKPIARIVTTRRQTGRAPSTPLLPL